MPTLTQVKILESILRAERNKANPREGIVKSHLIEYCSLKSTTADKYFTKLVSVTHLFRKADY